MRSLILCMAVVLSILSTACLGADGPPPAVGAPADFKLKLELFGPIKKEPVAKGELIVRKGVGYQFLAEQLNEITIVDPAQASIVLLDLTRRVQTELSSKRLDNEIGRLHTRLVQSVERLEKSKQRSEQITAAMAKDMTDPNFAETFDDATGKLRLTNRSVELSVTGVAEPDRARLMMVTNCLAALIKLPALRDEESLPPFARLDALRRLSAVRGLRPTEMDLLLRLQGPPQRLRWVWTLVPTLTEREIEAISRLGRVRETAKFVSLEDYEAEDAK